jgi:hypothetical protein
MRDVLSLTGLLSRLLFSIPILGLMLRDAAEGGESAMLWFAVTVVSLLGLALLLFGLPGLVVGMLVVAALAMTTLAIIIRG